MKDSEVAYHFYATIQNKFHYAITNYTAAEIINKSVDLKKENMGLITWKNAADGRIPKSDDQLQRIISTRSRFVN